MPSLNRRSGAVLTLAIGFLVLFVGGGARFAIGLTLKPMVDEFGWARGDLGLAVALFQTVSAICMFAAGRFADRIDPRTVLGAGLIVAGTGIGLMALVTASWQVLLLYGVLFAIGNGMASLIPVGVLVTRAFPVRTGIANSVVTSGMSVGQLVVVAALAAVLAGFGWRSVYIWLAIMHFVAVPFVLAATTALRGKGPASTGSAPILTGLPIEKAVRLSRFWLILAVYAICGFQDFFVATNIVALAQDRGVDSFFAGDLLALMGLTALVGLIAAGLWSDRVGPIWPTVASFVVRFAIFGLILVDRSPLALSLFALGFGVTFMITAPLTVLFVRDSFGLAHLGALTGLITMVHQICGGLGAYMGTALFDATGSYGMAFWVMLFLSVLAVMLSLALLAAPVAPAFTEN